MTQQSRLRIAVVAGEESGDLLGSACMRAINQRISAQHTPDATPYYAGIGGETMAQAGLDSLFPMQELNLMGFAEVLPHLPRLVWRLHQTIRYIEKQQPDILLTIDSPGFTFPLVKALRKRGKLPNLRYVHYVAPTVWAYKPERAAKTAALFDSLLCLFPCEPAFFHKEGMHATHVGHPLPERMPQLDKAALKVHYPFPHIALLPGSRTTEIKRHVPIYKQVAHRLSALYPDASFTVLVPPAKADLVTQLVQDWPDATHIITSPQLRYEALAEADVALVKSGTITLETAFLGTAMVTTYKANAISAWFIRRHLRTPYVNLVNILLGRLAIPELLQEQCEPTSLTHAIQRLLEDREAASRQITASMQAIQMLAPPAPFSSAADMAASIILDGIKFA